MNGSARGVALVGLAGILFFSACQPSPLVATAEEYLQETTSFCADVGDYAKAYEDTIVAGSEWPDWHSAASSLVEALTEWELERPDELPTDVETAIDRYGDSFVGRLRGWDNVQALQADCDGIVDSLEQYVANAGA